MRIALRELKETLWRLRVARRAAFLTEAQDPVIAENLELVRILAALIRKSAVTRAVAKVHFGSWELGVEN